MADSIITLAQEAIIARLLTDCRDPYDEDDPTQLGDAVLNALQANPTRQHVAQVYHQRPGHENWNDEIDTTQMGKGWEIGGGTFWRRRFSVDVRCFLLRRGLDKSEASEAWSTLMGRMKHCLTRPYAAITDEWGEQLIYLMHVAQTDEASGGPPTNYIFSATFLLEFLCSSP